MILFILSPSSTLFQHFKHPVSSLRQKKASPISLLQRSSASRTTYSRLNYHRLLTMSSEAEQVINNTAESRYTLSLAEVDEPACLTYEIRTDASGTTAYDLTHTYVSPAMRGKGIASRLVKFAVQHAREDGHKIIPTCSYIESYMKRHPDDHDVLLQ